MHGLHQWNIFYSLLLLWIRSIDWFDWLADELLNYYQILISTELQIYAVFFDDFLLQTYTMIGTPTDPGIMVRVMNDLFTHSTSQGMLYLLFIDALIF